MAFHHEIRVRYGEVDQQGVVFNAHYLAYVDDAMTRWFDCLGRPYTDLGWDCMVGRAALQWRSSATVGEVIAIEADVRRFGTTSFDVGFDLHVADRAVCTAELTYIGVRLGTTETMPMPDELRQALLHAAAG